MSPSNSGNIKSAERSFAILEYILEMNRPVSNKELAAEFRLPKSTMHHFVKTLVNLGYLKLVPGRHYTVGPRFITMAQAVDSSPQRFSAAQPILQDLRERLDASVFLNAYDFGMCTSVFALESRQRHGARQGLKPRKPSMHCTASGKLLLAHADASVRTYYFSGPLKQWTKQTLTDPDGLMRELHHIHSQGFAEDREEHFDGIRCLAVPVFDDSSNLMASVSVRVPSFRMEDEVRENLLEALHGAAGFIRDLCIK